jgi:hypothetical protein
LTGVAVKLTVVPAHTLFADAEILILTGLVGFTVIETVLEIAELPVAHVALEVSWQVIASPFEGA